MGKDNNGQRVRRCARAVRLALCVSALIVSASCTASTARGPATSAAGTGTAAIGVSVFPVTKRLPLPAVTAPTLEGARLTLSALSGHGVLVINVWASWCVNCRAESAALARLAVAYRRRHVDFLGIDEQDPNASAARRFVATSGTTYPQLLDPAGATLAKLSVLPNYGIPSTLVVDRHSRMAARIVGALTAPQLQRLVTRIAAEH